MSFDGLKLPSPQKFRSNGRKGWFRCQRCKEDFSGTLENPAPRGGIQVRVYEIDLSDGHKQVAKGSRAITLCPECSVEFYGELMAKFEFDEEG